MAAVSFPLVLAEESFEEEFKDWLVGGVASSVIYTAIILVLLFLLIRFLR